MTETVADSFFYLQADARNRNSDLVFRPILVLSNKHDISLGIDSLGNRHLLVPVLPGADIPRFRESESLTLGLRQLTREGIKNTYADLACTEPSLQFVFEKLCGDVLEQIARSPGYPLAVLKKTLDNWHALFANPPTGMTREAQLGLLGELVILGLLAEHEPVSALDSWQGPLGGLHDFVRGAVALEVKTTSGQYGKSINVSSLNQLDPCGGIVLYLAVVHLEVDEKAPSIPELMDTLVRQGIPEFGLARKAAAYGYTLDESENRFPRFKVRSIRMWNVGEDFPGLRRSELGSQRLIGVDNVTYKLNLESAGEPLSDEDYKEVTGAFVWDK